MEKLKWIIVGLMALVMVDDGNKLLAQTATSSDSFSGIQVELSSGQVEPLSLNATDMRSVRSLSDTQLAAFVLALDATPVVAFADQPRKGMAGTYYSWQHPEWPPLPGNTSQSAVWTMNDFYLLDDVNYNYNAPVKSRTGMQAMSLDGLPSPGGDGGTNVYYPNGNSYTPPDYGTNLWIAQISITNGYLMGLASNTVAGVSYEIQTNGALGTTNWSSTGLFVPGSEVTNWTAFTALPVSLTNHLFFRLKSWASSDGSGLPNWWEQEYGVTDPYGDPDNDGWNNLQEFQNGTSPTSFNTPPAPQGVAVKYDTVNGTVSVSWLASPGAVTGYTVTDSDGHSFNVSTNGFTESIPYLPNFDYGTPGDPTIHKAFQVQARYGGGNSALSSLLPLQPSTVWGNIIPSPSGGNLLAVGNFPPDAVKVRVLMFYAGYYDANNDRYPFTIVTNVDIPVEAITNGFCPAPASWLNLAVMPAYPFYVEHHFYLQSVDAAGNVSGGNYLGENWGPDVFYDGRTQLKQNLIFQFRIADTVTPFGFMTYAGDNVLGFSNFTYVRFPSDYVYAGFFDINNNNGIYGSPDDSPSLNIYRPFEDNVLYRNFASTTGDVDVNGNMTSGVQLNYSFDDGTNLDLHAPPAYLPATDAAGSALLDANTAKWLCTYSAGLTGNGHDGGFGSEGFSYDENFNLNFSNNVVNYWGLPFVSAKVFYYDGNNNFQNTVLNAGDSLNYVGPTAIYMNAAQPQFQVVKYDFWNDGYYGNSKNDGDDGPSWPDSRTNLPGNSAFSPTNASSLLLVGVGESVGIAAFTKLAVQNGYAGAYGYLQQYLDKAYALDDNGNLTTNLTGVVSPYGNYFATQAGAAAVVTLPDPDTGERGTGIVHAVSLQLDANHDGNMDLSWNGPDTTSPNSPYVFWCNNNFDRWDYDGTFGTSEQDDVEQGSDEDTVLNTDPNTPDCNYHNLYGDRVIPCPRDLEDFSRLWVCGVTSELVSNLPYGSTVTFSWGDLGNPDTNNPTIDLFQGGDGSMGYLTNETVGASLINATTHPCIGRVSPGQSVQMPAYLLENFYGRNHLIWCGVSNGTGGLTLTIADGSGNVLVQTSAYIKIVDIKQLYERWTVGDNAKVAPLTTAIPAAEGLPPGTPAFRYPAPATNTPYILHVHGYNMPTWAKDRFAETEYKRLYWQGYQGRFGAFNWPTAANPVQFGGSELQAWLSAQGLLNKLEDLNNEYPGNVYLTVHSLGNVVAGEALRLATHQVVNTYVAMQGAVAAQAYDATTTFRDLGGIYNGAPNRYAYYPTNGGSCYFNASAGAGTYVNFFNTNDWALQQAWLTFQDAKPVLSPSYSYNPETDIYYKNFGLSQLSFPTDTYELFANFIQAQCYALGAQPGVGGVFSTNNQINLPSVWPPDAGQYKAHIWHSAEFRSDNAQRWQFWNKVLVQMKLKPQ